VPKACHPNFIEEQIPCQIRKIVIVGTVPTFYACCDETPKHQTAKVAGSFVKMLWFAGFGSFPKMSGICFLTMPGPLSCVAVLKGDFVFIFSDGFDVHPDFGEYSGFFAGIERVIDGFFDGGE
jgi:hypothetical protein